jgi:hypothetical protein
MRSLKKKEDNMIDLGNVKPSREMAPGKMRKLDPLPIRKVKIRDGFWGKSVRQVRETIIPYQWAALNDRLSGAPSSHALENFRIAAGQSKGDFYGWVFQDSDIAKWLEAVSYCLINQSDLELERLADEVIDVIVKAQQPDGYLNTYFTIKEPQMRWKNLRDNHELYCAGHMIEAAVAYYEAAGKRKLLDAVCRLADHIDLLFGPEPGKRRGYPGHPEAELALLKLYRTTGEERYLKLSKFFVDERGRKPLYFELEARERGEERPQWPFWTPAYCQSHLPVRKQTEAVGHAVRAMYLYCGMADLAFETGDETLFKACKKLWESVTKRRMYITGGVGSSEEGEAFTFDYDLPNDTAYAETCASIGLVLWAHRMLRLNVDRKYADVMERALYNGVLSGVSLDGTKYFYTNPLEVWPQACKRRHDLKHILTVRQPWFSCACCPPNLARLLASIGQYVYSKDESTIYVHLFVDSEAEVELAGGRITLIQETEYPWKGDINIGVHTGRPLEFTLSIRIPRWCKHPELKINGDSWEIMTLMRKGYVRIKRIWRNKDKVELLLPIPVERVRANPNVRATAGKVAICRGPIVYCLEEVDNGPNLAQIALPKEAKLTVEFEDQTLGGVAVIRGVGLRSEGSSWGDDLYNSAECEERKIPIRAVPYYTWGNRGLGEMAVWIRERFQDLIY